ncbi:MAG: hypothetical protein ACTHX2_11305 [Microbacterium sp.]
MPVRQHGGRIGRGIGAGLTSVALAAAALVGVAAPAQAAGVPEKSVGLQSAAGWVGSYYVEGVGNVYCLQPGREPAYTEDPETVSEYNGTYTHDSGGVTGTAEVDITPREAFEISYIAATYGQLDLAPGAGTQDEKEWAAATEVAIWQRSVDELGNGYSPYSWFHSRWDQWPGVDQKINTINDEVADAEPSATGGGSGSLEVVMENSIDGEVVVSMSPADAVATLTIDGATFPGGQTSISGVTDGQRIPITGDAVVDPENPSKQYNISVEGSAVGTGSGFGEQVQILQSSGQMMAHPAEETTVAFELEGAAADPILEFSPVVTTQAPEFVDAGESFTDVLTGGVAEGSDPWLPTTSGYIPVEATGTLYGPMLSIPDEQETAPDWAPVAGTAEATLEGPGEVTVETDFVSDEAGYYTWVWEIDGAAQSDLTALFLPEAEDYHFRDNFAQVVETSITPSGIVATSQVSEEEAAITDEISDTLQVSATGGGWIQKDGARVPVTFRGTAYAVDEEPSISDTMPSDAVEVGTTTLTVDKPGAYESETIQAPAQVGYMTWVWEIREEDQPEDIRGYVSEWNDQFGIPAETTELYGPTVGTRAETDVPVGDTFHDVATVTGYLPESGVDIHWELYEATQGENGEWVCGEGNLLWTSSVQRITETGDYTSDEAPFQSVGEYHWVEVIETPDGEEISRGICGVPNETTKVVEPEVTTKAQPTSELGGEIHDVATVTGPVAEDGYDLSFAAFEVPTTPEGEIEYPEGFTPVDGENNLQWVCETEPVFVSSEPVTVTKEGDYESESFVPERYGKYLWVETLMYTPEGEDEILIHRGECGVELETSYVFDVTTEAQDAADAGETATDTAIVDGFMPDGATVEFTAYQVDADAPQAPEAADVAVCTEDSVLGTTEPVEIDGGMHDDTRIESDEIHLPDSSVDYKVYWIETVRDSDGDVIAEGECGLPEETTTVSANEEPSALAVTGGGDNTLPLLIGGGSVLAAGLALMIVQMVRRRRQAEAVTASAGDDLVEA